MSGTQLVGGAGDALGAERTWKRIMRHRRVLISSALNVLVSRLNNDFAKSPLTIACISFELNLSLF